MATLTVNPVTETFAKVPHLEEALKEFEVKAVANYLEQFGSIFAKHNAHQHFGISLSHRHFDIDPKQILVHSLTSDKSVGVSIPWDVFNDSSVKPSDPAYLQSHKIEQSSKYVVPDNWIFDPDNDEGHLVPFEFRTSDTKEFVEPSEDFGKELFSALKKLGLEKILGVRTISDNTGGSYEITPSGIAANITTYGRLPDGYDDDDESEIPREKMITVGWMYGDDGKLRLHTLECSGHKIRCRGCNHFCMIHSGGK